VHVVWLWQAYIVYDGGGQKDTHTHKQIEKERTRERERIIERFCVCVFVRESMCNP